MEAVYADENIWLSQKMMEQLYDVDVRTINYHLKKVFSDHELEADSVIQYFRITAADGKFYPPDLQEEAVKTVLQQAELPPAWQSSLRRRFEDWV